MSAGPPALRIDPSDEPRLAAQARALAAGAAPGPDEARAALQVVTFRVGGLPCALPALAVERAVARLGTTTDVPQAAGGARPVAWVDEQAVVVTDLVALSGLPPRPPAALAQAPALLVRTGDGPVAVAVEGPLELGEAALAQQAGPALAALPGLGVAGRLADGAALLSVDWLRAHLGGGGAP